MKSILLLSAFFSLQAFAGNSVSLSVKAQTSDTFERRGNDYVYVTGSSTSTVDLKGSFEGQELDFHAGPVTVEELADSKISIVSGKSVRLSSESLKYDKTVKAKVSKTLFTRKLKSIVVPSSEMNKIFSESMKQAQSNLMNQMNIRSDELELNYTMNFSDYACVTSDEGAVLTCKMNLEVRLDGKSL